MEKINSIIEEIAETLKEYPIENREQILFEEIEREIIYYSNVWDILNEARPTTFEVELVGYVKTPEQLAWSVLYEQFLNRFETLIFE